MTKLNTISNDELWIEIIINSLKYISFWLKRSRKSHHPWRAKGQAIVLFRNINMRLEFSVVVQRVTGHSQSSEKRSCSPCAPISPCTLRPGWSVSTPAGSWLFISSEVVVINEALNTSSFPWTSWVNRPRYSKSGRFGSTATGSQNAATQTSPAPRSPWGEGVGVWGEMVWGGKVVHPNTLQILTQYILFFL